MNLRSSTYVILPLLASCMTLGCKEGRVGQVRWVQYAQEANAVISWEHVNPTSGGGYEQLRIRDATTGKQRALLVKASANWTFRGPAGHYLWRKNHNALERIDLRDGSVQEADALKKLVGSKVGGDLRMADSDEWDAQRQLLKIDGADGKPYLLSASLEVKPYEPQERMVPRLQPCKSVPTGVTDKVKPIKPIVRGCAPGGNRFKGLAQHASAAFGDDVKYSATAWDEDDNHLWTKTAAELLPDGPAWFGDAAEKGDAVVLVLVQGSALHAVEVKVADGAVVSKQAL